MPTCRLPQPSLGKETTRTDQGARATRTTPWIQVNRDSTRRSQGSIAIQPKFLPGISITHQVWDPWRIRGGNVTIFFFHYTRARHLSRLMFYMRHPHYYASPSYTLLPYVCHMFTVLIPCHCSMVNHYIYRL